MRLFKLFTPFLLAVAVLATPLTANAESAAASELKERIRKMRGYGARKLLRSFRTSRSEDTQQVVSYYRDHARRAKLFLKGPLKFQTGPYKALYLTDGLFRTKCLKEILWSASQLENHFPEFTFQIDGNIRNCDNLKRGVEQMVHNKSTVIANVSRFSTPMHSVYLTNKTKFNHHRVGKMGLYVDVNKNNEISRRLVEFRVGINDIRHERARIN